MAAGQADAQTNASQIIGPAPASPGETNTAAQFERLLAEDEAAHSEVETWLQGIKEAKVAGATPQSDLDIRIRERLEPVRRAYEDFLSRNPGHVKARLAFGNFLNERQDESGAQIQWEKALELDPRNAEAYNSLAGRYSETGPAKKAFDYFVKAIELSPGEAAFYHSFADSVYVLRKSAMEHYRLENEQQVYAKALELYRSAARLDPTNYIFAFDFAQTYYAITPLRSSEALQSWTNALKAATNDLQRQEVCVHMARVKMLAGQLADARAQLKAVSNAPLDGLKQRLIHAIEDRERTNGATNQPATSQK